VLRTGFFIIIAIFAALFFLRRLRLRQLLDHLELLGSVNQFDVCLGIFIISFLIDLCLLIILVSALVVRILNRFDHGFEEVKP